MWEIIFAILAGIFVLIIISGYFISSRIKFQRTLTIEADKKIIYAYLEDLKKWNQWSQWSIDNDAKIVCTYEGKEKGEGAIMRWKGKKMGAGKMEIISSIPNKFLEVEILFNNSGFKLQSNFIITPAENATHLTWEMNGKIKRFGIAKIIGLFLPKWMGKDMQIAMKILKITLEKKDR